NTTARETEDRVFRLRSLHVAEAPKDEIRGAAQELLKTQRADGGWAQLASLDSDAYATGTALVALHQAGAVATADLPYRNGLRFLLGRQLDDGSWHVPTRSTAIQTYYESGYPHGEDQFISITAAGWATTARALALPDKNEAAAKAAEPPKPALPGLENFEVEGRKAFVILPSSPPPKSTAGAIPWG